jgi:hypothetical protein
VRIATLRELAATLAWAQEETVGLARCLLLAQETAGDRRADVERAVKLVLSDPFDPNFFNRLIVAAEDAAVAEREEIEASEDWWAHVLGVHGVISAAEELGLIPGTVAADGSNKDTPRRLRPPRRPIERRGKCPHSTG